MFGCGDYVCQLGGRGERSLGARGRGLGGGGELGGWLAGREAGVHVLVGEVSDCGGGGWGLRLGVLVKLVWNLGARVVTLGTAGGGVVDRGEVMGGIGAVGFGG